MKKPSGGAAAKRPRGLKEKTRAILQKQIGFRINAQLEERIAKIQARLNYYGERVCWSVVCGIAVAKACDEWEAFCDQRDKESGQAT